MTPYKTPPLLLEGGKSDFNESPAPNRILPGSPSRQTSFDVDHDSFPEVEDGLLTNFSNYEDEQGITAIHGRRHIPTESIVVPEGARAYAEAFLVSEGFKIVGPREPKQITLKIT